MKGDWIDFKVIRAGVSMESVLARAGILNGLRKKGDELVGKCPLHPGAEGERAFNVNLTRSVFHCFSCGAKGDVIALTAALEKVSIREAALKLQEWFLPGQRTAPHAKGPPERKREAGPEAQKEPAAMNAPLKFELQNIDHAHPYLAGRGISEATARLFGVGHFPGKGSMAGRVVIPIRSPDGELLAYAGRSIDDSDPKYKLPAGFKKSLVLYNLHAALKADRSRGVIVTEGFFDTMRIHDSGFPCVVALMGCSMSEEQESRLLANWDRVWIMLDGDEAGRNASAEIAARLMRKMFVRVVAVPEGKQPDMLTAEELQKLLAFEEGGRNENRHA